MTGMYERRKSGSAVWCQRLAVFAAPVLLLTVFLHRSAVISHAQMFWLFAVGIGMLVLSLLFGARAAIDLWEKGYEGGRATINGIILSTLIILPFGYQLYEAIRKPELNDVSTDVLTPPAYPTKPAGPRSFMLGPDGAYDSHFTRIIVSSYPELVGRRYNAPPERVYEAIAGILQRWRAVPIATVNAPELPGAENRTQEADGELAGSAEEVEAGDLPGAAGGEAEAEILIQARVVSLIVKLPHEFLIRLTPLEDSTLVDIRSSSSWGNHDFGSNAGLVSDFLELLDESLAGIAGEG